MNGMNGYLLLVVCLSTFQKQVQGTACTVSTASMDCTAPFDICQNDICKIGVGGDCSSDTTSCVANAGCMSNECDCTTSYVNSGGTCVETPCSTSTDCTAPFNVCQDDICKIGVRGDCSSYTTRCVANAGCISNECDCSANFAHSGSGTCVEPLNCYSCSIGCNKDDVTASTQIKTIRSIACTYCYIAWNDQDAARGCLTSATATSKSITNSGCSDGWTEGLTGTGCACDSALCNETPTAVGYTQNTAFTLKASATLVSMAIFLHHLFII